MKQLKKGLWILAYSLFGVLAVNAQTEGNLVKNGDFSENTISWQSHSENGGDIDAAASDKPRNGLALQMNNYKRGDYVSQKLEKASGSKYELSFSYLIWGAFFDVELSWDNGKVTKVTNIVDDNGYFWKENQVFTGDIPEGATSVTLKFICADNIDESPDKFYIDDVIFKVSGEAVSIEPLEAPKNIKVPSVAKDKFTLTWDNVKDATGYIVNVNGKNYSTNTNSYSVTGLSAGKNYPVEIKATSEKTKNLENKVAKLEIYTLSETRADGANVFFDEGDFEQGSSKGWMNHNNISIDKTNIGGNETAKLRIQNETTALVARSYNFSVEGNAKYSFFAEAYTPEETRNGVLTFNVVWKKADGERITTNLIESTSENIKEAWETLGNEVTAPADAVIAEIQFQLPSGDHHEGVAPVFYVDNVKVLKGAVAPLKAEVKDISQRNAMLSWSAIKDKSYKITIGDKNFEAKGGMFYISGLVPNTSYTAEVSPMDATDKKLSVMFKTINFSREEGERVAYLANIDENGNIPSKFYYNISDLDGEAIKEIEVTFNNLPATIENGYVVLPETENGKLLVKVTQEGGEVTVLTYNLITKK